ncbi:MAG: glycosyltransferase, partial [Cyclobacteriaceae bacterium]
MHELSASIVVYKGNLNMLSEAIGSFIKATTVSKLYIVDNSPTDRARHLVDNSRIEYIFNGRNVGFGPGHNIALRKAISEGFRYHVVINPDVYFDDQAIKKLFAFMETH